MRVRIAALAFLVAVSACKPSERTAPVSGAPAPQPDRAPDQAKPAPDKIEPAASTDFRYQFVAAAKAIGPAVVSVTAETQVEQQHSRFEGTPFDFFFRGTPERQQDRALRRGIGSGVIVDTHGHVLTNNHVVEGADKVKVVLANGHEWNAKVVGTDPKTDLAVIKIDPQNEQLKAAELGDSEQLQVGEWVVAAGSPFGLRQTVSAGIVSAIGRGNVGISEYEDFIQTDAAINPGNSGGPLVDLTGRVIGINTAIASQTGGNAGIGFAIPIAMAKIIMDQLINTGKVVRGYVGLYIGDVTQDLARSFSFKGVGGALVQDVTPDAPGARAGIRPGDIIFERNGRPILNASAFRNGVADSPPGSDVTLKLWRDEKELEVKVKLAELPGGADPARPGKHNSTPGPARLGMQLSDPTPEIRTRLSLGDAPGALIVQVKPDSPAERAGLKPGDLVTNVGGREVHNAAEAQKALIDERSPMRVRVIRDGHGMFVVIPVGD